MRILMFTNQYGKRGNFITGFIENNASYHCIYPTDAVEATQDNIDAFLEGFDQFTLESVEYIDGIVKWNTANTIYTGKGI